MNNNTYYYNNHRNIHSQNHNQEPNHRHNNNNNNNVISKSERFVEHEEKTKHSNTNNTNCNDTNNELDTLINKVTIKPILARKKCTPIIASSSSSRRKYRIMNIFCSCDGTKQKNYNYNNNWWTIWISVLLFFVQLYALYYYLYSIITQDNNNTITDRMLDVVVDDSTNTELLLSSSNSKSSSNVPITELRPIPSNLVITNHVFCGGCFFAKIQYPDDNSDKNEETNKEKKKKKRPQTCGQLIRNYIGQYFDIIDSSKHNTYYKDDRDTKTAITKAIHQLYEHNRTLYYQYMEQAAYETYENHPYSCARCNPTSCRRSGSSNKKKMSSTNNETIQPERRDTVVIDNNNNNKDANDDNNNNNAGEIFHRYDTVAPKIYNAWTHYLPSIPDHHRFPVTGMDQLDEYFTDWNNKQKDYFFEYNPSIVLLPDSEIQYIIHPQTGVMTKAVYLASYRVSNLWWCFSMDYIRQLNRTNGYIEYTGLALLDENLTILKDGIFNNYGRQDPRLFILRNYNNVSQIYWTVENTHRALWINEPTVEQMGPHSKKEVIRSVFPSNSNSSLSTIYMSRKWGCRTIGGGQYFGKNIIYFDDPSITSETVPLIAMNGNNYTTDITGPVTVIENWPPQDDNGLHRTSLVQVSKPIWCTTDVINYEADDGEIVSTSKPTLVVTTERRELGYNDLVQSDDNTTHATSSPNDEQYEPIQPSFYTLEEVWFGKNLIADVPPWHGERGSACCIEVIDPRTNKMVLVGISHANVRAEAWPQGLPDNYYEQYFRPGHNSYLSRFYAFEPTMPYTTVALSGHFCWPMSSTWDAGNNPYHGRGDTMFYLESTNQTDTGSCAKIHFVMSITYKANSNQESILVAYGVDDCVPRIIEIKTVDVVELLFYGFSRQTRGYNTMSQ